MAAESCHSHTDDWEHIGATGIVGLGRLFANSFHTKAPVISGESR